MPFSVDEIDRYDRQVLLPEWGAAGQERVRAAAATVIGHGPAASMAALYLAGAGVGSLAVHPDLVDGVRALNPFVEVRAAATSSSAAAPGVSVTIADGVICGVGDREAVGAAVAVEALKAALGLPCLAQVTLPSFDAQAGGE